MDSIAHVGGRVAVAADSMSAHTSGGSSSSLKVPASSKDAAEKARSYSDAIDRGDGEQGMEVENKERVGHQPRLITFASRDVQSHPANKEV